MPKIKGRGTNPNSHRNKPRLGVESGTIKLTPEQWKLLEKLGEGNRSAGARSLFGLAISLNAENIDDLFSRLSALGKAKTAIQMLLDGHPKAREYAEGVLYDLEDLEIENFYLDAVADGEVVKSKDIWIA